MTGLDSAASGRDLIPGDSEALGALGRQLAALSAGLGDAAAILERVDAGSWSGAAADAFRGAVRQQPKKYADAADVFSLAGVAVQTYSQELADAQRQAGNAISEWHIASAKTSAWRSQGQQAGHATPAGSDPGAAGRDAAIGSLNSARAQLDRAASLLQSRLDQATRAAPQEPGFFHRMFRDAENIGKTVFGFGTGMFTFVVGLDAVELKTAWHVIEGAAQGVQGIAVGVWDLGKFGYALVTNPIGTIASTAGTAYTIADFAVHHPAKFSEAFGKAVFNVDEWEHDPAKAFGEFVPTVVLAVATVGAGTLAGSLSDSSAIAGDLSDAAAASGDLETAAQAAQAAHEMSGTADLINTVIRAQEIVGDAENIQGLAQAANSSGEGDGMGLDMGVSKGTEVIAGRVLAPHVVTVVVVP